MSTTIEVVCYKYKPLKNKEFPLKIRITKDRKIKYVSLGVSIHPQYWDFTRNRPTPTCPNREYLEQLIANKLCECKSKVVECKAENKEFTATTLKEQLFSKSIKAITVGALFTQIIQELHREQRFGYAASIEQTYRSLIFYNGYLEIHFPDMDTAWLKRYESWLRCKGTAENTIGIRFRTLRMIYNRAIERGYVKAENDDNKMIYRTEENQDQVPDFKWTVSTAVYRVDVNTNDLTISIQKTGDVEAWLMGEAIPDGWNWDALPKMTSAGNGVFLWTGTLSKGQIKFPLEFDRSFGGVMAFAKFDNTSVPPVNPKPRPLIFATGTPAAATSGATMSVVVSAMPPVLCLSTLTPGMDDKSTMSPERAIAMVNSVVSSAVMPRRYTAISQAAA